MIEPSFQSASSSSGKNGSLDVDIELETSLNKSDGIHDIEIVLNDKGKHTQPSMMISDTKSQANEKSNGHKMYVEHKNSAVVKRMASGGNVNIPQVSLQKSSIIYPKAYNRTTMNITKPAVSPVILPVFVPRANLTITSVNYNKEAVIITDGMDENSSFCCADSNAILMFTTVSVTIATLSFIVLAVTFCFQCCCPHQRGSRGRVHFRPDDWWMSGEKNWSLVPVEELKPNRHVGVDYKTVLLLSESEDTKSSSDENGYYEQHA